jgi:DNA-binding beta-propeller fold protein YncE
MSTVPKEDLTRCVVCLETIEAQLEYCPHCDEKPGRFDFATATPPSIAPPPLRVGWWRQHWRPTVTIGLVGALLTAGIALRYLAPERYQPPRRLSGPVTAKAACDTPCWASESCQLGRCVWQTPNDVTHLSASPRSAGPFSLPEDYVDALAIDDERIAVSHLRGVEFINARNGETRSLVNDAPHAQKLFRVGKTIYACAPKRIYVIDTDSERVLKSIDMGGPVESLSLGAAGWRAVVSAPSVRAVAVIATDYHAEISRFHFGDDPIGPVAIDDSGKRALTTTGRVPLPGMDPPRIATRFGAMYAFNPSRLPTQQDRVRSAMTDNAVDVLMLPDGRTSYLVLRKSSELVVQEHQPSGTVRQLRRIKTCRQPEAIALVRRTRRAVVRCNLGRSVDIIDLDTHKSIKRIPLGVRVSDLAISPDGMQAIAALPQGKKGAVAVIDLASFEVQLHGLTAEPHRIRISPSGKTVLVLSDRSKVAWVLQ